MNECKVVVVDDHPIVRDGLVRLIDAMDGFNVSGAVGSCAEALDLLKEATPDVVIVDLALSDGSGLELIKMIRAQGKKDRPRVLVWSAHQDRLYAERVLKAGAAGYVNKSSGGTQMKEALSQILKGRIYLSPEMTEHMLQRTMRGEKDLTAPSTDSLSDRELEVFELLGEGLTTKEIAKRLYLSPKTIETHREHIRNKLNIETNNDLIRQAAQWILSRDQDTDPAPAV